MKKNYFYIKSSLVFALLFWILESTIHYFIFNDHEFELIPQEANELWMRIIIFILLISFGLFAERHSNKLIEKEKEKQEIYKTMVNASQHILNNFLQSMTLFRDIAANSNGIDEKLIPLYDQTIKTTTDQINNLKHIQHPSKKTIEEKFMPK